jgi:hypothetical protein
MNHPSMTTRGRRIAALCAIVVVFALPKHVECGYPAGEACQHKGTFGRICTPYELEPFGFYLLELATGTDVGFAYKSGEDCR